MCTSCSLLIVLVLTVNLLIFHLKVVNFAMAKFGSYFGLCPLIDQKSLLGISEDFESDNVIVTLGKNIAMKYRLVDQNQITSWTTKEKFTSPVIFDPKTEKYVAVFNHLFIRCWRPDVSNLDKVKKFKLKSNIETLVVIDNASFVIFKTGDVVLLEDALTNHKLLMPKTILDENEEYIVDIMCCTLKADKYIGLLVGNCNSKRVTHLLWTSFDSLGNRTDYSKLPLRSTSELAGCCFQLFDQQIQILTLWSDGKLCVKSIEDISENLGETFCVIESISCKDAVSIVSLDKDYLAIYGGNSNQEGALLIIYNMQFKVTQCMQPFKLQALGVKLFKINEKLFVPVGQNLAVVPYRLEKEQLSALVGSHSLNVNTGKDIQVVHQLEEVNWTGSKTPKKKESKINSIITDYSDQGCSESTIFQNLLPELIENNNIADLTHLLHCFLVIPENCHAKVLDYILELPKDHFKNRKLVSNKYYLKDLQPLERYDILKLILNKPLEEFDNVHWKMKITPILKLLKFILFLFKYDEGVSVSFKETLCKWITLIIRTNLLTFMYHRDEMKNILAELNDYIDTECSPHNNHLLFNIDCISERKKIAKMPDSMYTIEKIDL